MEAARALTICAILLASLMLGGCLQKGALPPDVAPSGLPLQAPERIPINLRTSWPALLAAIEAEIPRCAASAGEPCSEAETQAGSFIFRHEDGWLPTDKRVLGQPMGIQIAVWRQDPAKIAIAGNHLTASLSLFYRVRIGLLSGRQLASCGYGEGPRALTVKLDGNLHLDPGWFLDPDLHVSVLPTTTCAVSFLNIDVTDRLLGPVRDTLQKEVGDIAARIRTLTDIRPMAATLWARLSEPVTLGERVWLVPNLSDAHVRLPEVTPDQRYLTMALAIGAKPLVVVGRRSMAAIAPLPALTAGPVAPAFSLKVRAAISYDKAATIVREHLDAALARHNLAGIRLTDVRVSGRGNNVLLALEVRGLVAGTFYLFGVPHFAAAEGGSPSGRLTFDHPHFTFVARGPISRFMVSMFRRRIERDLETAAWWDATPELEKAAASLENVLNRELSAGARLEGHLSRFGPGEARVGPDGLEAWYRVAGKVSVVVAPLN